MDRNMFNYNRKTNYTGSNNFDTNINANKINNSNRTVNII